MPNLSLSFHFGILVSADQLPAVRGKPVTAEQLEQLCTGAGLPVSHEYLPGDDGELHDHLAIGQRLATAGTEDASHAAVSGAQLDEAIARVQALLRKLGIDNEAKLHLIEEMDV